MEFNEFFLLAVIFVCCTVVIVTAIIYTSKKEIFMYENKNKSSESKNLIKVIEALQKKVEK